VKPNGSWCIISPMTRNVLETHICSSPVTKKSIGFDASRTSYLLARVRFTAHRNDCNNGTQDLKE